MRLLFRSRWHCGEAASAARPGATVAASTTGRRSQSPAPSPENRSCRWPFRGIVVFALLAIDQPCQRRVVENRGDALASAARKTHGDQQGDQQHCERTGPEQRSEEHTSELQSLMRISYAVFCLKKK